MVPNAEVAACKSLGSGSVLVKIPFPAVVDL